MRESSKKKYFITVLILIIVAIFVVGIVLFALFKGVFSTPSNTASIGIIISAIIGAASALASAIIATVITNRLEKNDIEPLELSKKHSQQVEEIARLTQQKFELQKQQLDLEKQKQMLNRLLEAVNLSEEDPRLAIVISFQSLETEIDRAINQLLPTDIKTAETLMKESSDTFSYKMGLMKKYLEPEQIVALLNLYDLRNRIVHGEVGPQEITQDKVKDYVQQFIGLARSLLSIEDLSEDKSL